MKDDLSIFNSKWVGRLMQSPTCLDVVESVPEMPESIDRSAVVEVVGSMSSAFVRLAVPVKTLGQLLNQKDSSVYQEMTSVQSVSIVHDWLTLARLIAKDARSGRYGSMFYMHMSWDEVVFFADLSNAEIQRMAVILGNCKRAVLEWAWPNLFKGVREVHPNLYSSYAMALAA